jgi:hypothetical protein
VFFSVTLQKINFYFWPFYLRWLPQASNLINIEIHAKSSKMFCCWQSESTVSNKSHIYHKYHTYSQFYLFGIVVRVDIKQASYFFACIISFLNKSMEVCSKITLISCLGWSTQWGGNNIIEHHSKFLHKNLNLILSLNYTYLYVCLWNPLSICC